MVRTFRYAPDILLDDTPGALRRVEEAAARGVVYIALNLTWKETRKRLASGTPVFRSSNRGAGWILANSPLSGTRGDT